MPRSINDIQNYWNDVHRQKHVGALSGCTYSKTIEFLELDKILKKGNRVLEIGVGLGYVTEGLKENGMIVSALDISQEALDRVKDLCENTYLTTDMDSLPSNYFDIIICLNVIQHIPTYILKPELEQIIRSLKPKGVFALEFVSSNLSEDTGSDEFLENNPRFDENIGCYCRNPKYLRNLINTYSGSCKLVYDYGKEVNEDISGCYIFHVSK